MLDVGPGRQLAGRPRSTPLPYRSHFNKEAGYHDFIMC